ncbi:hypothetical protein EUGRSUZ_J00750 [Eucalyptus grandis]|uniref:Uncharacterized protein n=2 Tax=Eucalyptus grandis TaxID=71139 RepID=A0ACC3J2V1_EUCGR|nr:hypothetical protein EUGRSUZ_J00750 [Eucalyptus grandis]
MELFGGRLLSRAEIVGAHSICLLVITRVETKLQQLRQQLSSENFGRGGDQQRGRGRRPREEGIVGWLLFKGIAGRRHHRRRQCGLPMISGLDGFEGG